MNALNFVRTAVVILVLAVLVGCSDQITSSGDSQTKSSGKKMYSSETEENIPAKNVFRVQIGIKPYRSFKFDASNTPYAKFTALEVQRVFDVSADKVIGDCQDILIYSTSSKEDKWLNCRARGFSLSDIVIQNTSSKFILLNVTLDGVRAKIYKESDSE